MVTDLGIAIRECGLKWTDIQLVATESIVGGKMHPGANISKAHQYGWLMNMFHSLAIPVIRTASSGKRLSINFIFPTWVKQWVVPEAKANKDKIMLGVYKRYGLEFDTSDETDAYILSRIALETYLYDEANEVVDLGKWKEAERYFRETRGLIKSQSDIMIKILKARRKLKILKAESVGTA
jgi:hypothetical protein